MGTINYVVKMMQDNPDLNFSEGHTDPATARISSIQYAGTTRLEAVKSQLGQIWYFE